MSYCTIAPGHPHHAPYHDREYGFPINDDAALFERLVLEINQAGLSWLTILTKRENFRRAFDQFNLDTVAGYGARERERLLADAGIIRNRLKIASVIDNAKRIQELRRSHGSFAAWLDAHHPRDKAGPDGRVVQVHGKSWPVADQPRAAVGGDQVIAKRLASARPVLGICVGMQILFEAGHEHGEITPGVGCWPGAVRKLTAPVLPHMGWNVVARPDHSRLLADVDAGAMFYFVHSYAATQAPQRPGESSAVVGWTTHGEDFVALVEDGPLMATQFHPEKSGDAGAVLLANWLDALR